jgi:hypothetical protein
VTWKRKCLPPHLQRPSPPRCLPGAAAIGRVNYYVMNDFGGGTRRWKLVWVINFQQLGTLPLLGAFIVWYHNTNVAAWMIKALTFPDPNFQKRITIGAGIGKIHRLLHRRKAHRVLFAGSNLGIGFETIRQLH